MSNLTVQVTDRGTEPRSTSSDDVFSGTVRTVALSVYWVGGTFTVKLAG